LKVYFRVDGGDIYSVAMGHIYRCLKVARLLRDKLEIESTFIAKNYEEGVSKIKEEQFEILLLNNDCGLNDDVQLTSQYVSGKCLITDVRHYKENDVIMLKEMCECLIMFDDLGNSSISPNVVINPSAAPGHRKYDFRTDTEYFLGPEYFFIATKAAPLSSVKEKVLNIAVSLGGADPARYTEEFVRKTIPLSSSYNFTFILGPAYDDIESFKALLSSLDFKAKVLHNIPDLPALFSKMGLVVTAGGDTCLELAYIGTPGLVVPTIEYEIETAKYLEGQEVFINLGDIKKLSNTAVCSKIISFAENLPKRKKYSENGKALIDGNGAKKVMNIILPKIS